MIKRLAATALVLCLVALAALYSIQLMALNLEFYRSRWVRFRVPEDTGMDLEELSRVGRALIEYFVGDIPSPQVETIVYGTPRLLFSELELRHLEDVRTLFLKGFQLQRTLLVAALLGGVCLTLSSPRRTDENGKGTDKRGPLGGLGSLAKPLMVSGFLGIGLLLLLAVPAKVDFGNWWTRFHLMAFTNDLWLLDPETDWLIRMFPESFFLSAIKRIGLTYLGFCACYAFLGFLVRHFSSNHSH